MFEEIEEVRKLTGFILEGTTKSRAPSGVDLMRTGVSISMNPCSFM